MYCSMHIHSNKQYLHTSDGCYRRRPHNTGYRRSLQVARRPSRSTFIRTSISICHGKKITFTLPHIHLTRPEEDKVNSLIRKLYTFSRGVPSTACTEKLFATGTSNTFSEFAAAYLTAQYQRLLNSRTRRRTLTSLNVTPTPMNKHTLNIIHQIHENFCCPSSS